MDDDIVQALADKQAITEIIYRYCRGLDRMDRGLTLSCWHEGGTDNHGPLFSGTAEEFVDWVWPIHAAMVSTQHTINNILIDLDGDRAGAESYYTVYLRSAADGGHVDIVGGGRYCDTFEKIDGSWRIRHRESISDWLQHFEIGDTDTSSAIPPNKQGNKVISAERNPGDYSYRVIPGIGKKAR
jgi:hypothetical protein